jgi:ketosteroid isomerase-like protein
VPQASPSDLAFKINRLFEEANWEELRSVLHEDVEVRSFVSPGRTLHGIDAVLASTGEARGTLYNVKLDTIRELSPTVAVGTGSVRYEHPDGGIATTHTAWVWRFEDGKLLRSFTFGTLDDALKAAEAEIDDTSDDDEPSV